jgi:hypothetical protein
MLKRSLLVFLLAWPLVAMAQSQDQLIERYTAFAGSKENATSLVNGLRDSKEVRLTRGTATETFDPPTEKMGYGNIDNALALAEASLKQKGITNPTLAQIEASVVDVLKLRASGMGWGQIAQSHGIKLGDVKRADKASERLAKTERPGKAERVERPAKPERPERPERPGKGH